MTASATWLGSLLLAIAVLAGCQTTENIRKQPPPDNLAKNTPFTVLSFNIRLGLGIKEPRGRIYHMPWGRELGGVIDAIRAMDPDVVGLQEVAGIGQIKKLAEALDMNYAFEWHDTGSNRAPWWGVGVLSKFPIKASKGMQISTGSGDTKHIIIATVGTGGKDLTFVSVHKDKDLSDGSSIINILDSINGVNTPVVLIGDFNILPFDWRLERIAERFIDTATAVDTPSAREAVEYGTFLWFDGRIDYVFAEKAYFEVVDAGLAPGPHHNSSDHIAYFAKLKMKQ